jgi:hypothetical protein
LEKPHRPEPQVLFSQLPLMQQQIYRLPLTQSMALATLLLARLSMGTLLQSLLPQAVDLLLVQ